jgi:hypothetical protein
MNRRFRWPVRVAVLAMALPVQVTQALVAATLGVGAGPAVVGLRWLQPSTGRRQHRGPAAEREAA